MKKLLAALCLLLILDSCKFESKRKRAEVAEEEAIATEVATSVPAPATTEPAIPGVTYSGTVSEGPWKSFHLPFKKAFTGDIRLKNLTIKFIPDADASQSFFNGDIEIKNFPSDASIDDNKPEKAINITRAGDHIDVVFIDAKFTGTLNGDKIEGEFERKISINDKNARNTKDVYVTAPVTLYKQ